MMSRTKNYPKHRLYQHWQLKPLLQKLEDNIKDNKNIIDELTLRLD
jgi:hypothetical protein